MKLISDIDVAGKRVFLRADLDVGETLNDERPDVAGALTGRLTTNARLLNLEPTVKYLLEHGAARILIAGHIGRPSPAATDGKQATYDPKLSTRNLLVPLKNILGQEIFFQSNFEQQNGGKIVLFENLRFWPGEEQNDPQFAQKLANLADIYINEAFGVSHRAHASMVGVPAILPHAAGLHLQKEVEALSKLLDVSERPFVVVVGGAKIETKEPVVAHLAKIADYVLVGGEIAKEYQISNIKYQNYNGKVMVAKLTADGKDIDQESTKRFVEVIKSAKTLVWNGPMGVFEEGFDRGSRAVAQAIIDSKAFSVVGGGETTEFLASKNLLSPPAGGFSFVSAGGGAMLEFLAGKQLPGTRALE